MAPPREIPLTTMLLRLSDSNNEQQEAAQSLCLRGLASLASGPLRGIEEADPVNPHGRQGTGHRFGGLRPHAQIVLRSDAA